MDYKVLKYRSSHPKCIYCKYLKLVVPSIDVDPYYKCLAKDKIINFPDIIRICSCYDIEGGMISGKRNTLNYDHVLSLCEDPNSNFEEGILKNYTMYFIIDPVLDELPQRSRSITIDYFGFYGNEPLTKIDIARKYIALEELKNVIKNLKNVWKNYWQLGESVV